MAASIDVTVPKMVGGTERKKRRLPGRPASKELSVAWRRSYDSAASYLHAFVHLGARLSSLHGAWA